MSSAPPSGLLADARRREPHAIHWLLARFGPMVWGLCRTLDPHPEDAYQDVWAHLVDKVGRFDPEGSASFSTWLYTIVHHRLVDRARRRRARVRTEALAEEPTPPPDPHAQIEDAQRREHLRDALHRLPEAQRRAVVFHYLDEIPLADLARTEGVPVGTLKSRLHQARARLLELLRGMP